MKNGVTINDFIVKHITLGEFYLLNKEKISFDEDKLYEIIMFEILSPQEFLKGLNKKNVIITTPKKINWILNEENNVITASTETISSVIPYFKNKNSIIFDIEKIEFYDINNNLKINKINLKLAESYIYFIKKYSYKVIDEKHQIKIFDIKTYLELTKKISTDNVKYYPSGRVKVLPGYIQKFIFKDNSLILDIETKLKYLRENLNNKNININDLANEIEASIIAEKLNKNISVIEKSKLQILEKEAIPLYKTLYITNNKTVLH